MTLNTEKNQIQAEFKGKRKQWKTEIEQKNTQNMETLQLLNWAQEKRETLQEKVKKLK